jgi:hypothetical protein
MVEPAYDWASEIVRVRLLAVGSTRVIFSAEQAAAALWTYGEDALVESALRIPESDLPSLWTWAGEHWREHHGLPLTSRLVLDKVTAFAAINFLEGGPRSLAQERRRPHKAMPESLHNARPVPPDSPLLHLG